MTESRSISVVVSAMSRAACQRPGGREERVVRSDREVRASGREQGRLDAFDQGFLGGKTTSAQGRMVDVGGDVGGDESGASRLREERKLATDGRGGR